MKRSSLYELQESRGAVFQYLSGWQVPTHYGNPNQEYRAVTHAAGLLDLSYRGKLRLTGSDRATFLHGQVTQEIRSLRPGETRHGAIITAEGTMVADFRVLVTPDALLLDLEPPALEPAAAALDRFLIIEDVAIADVTEELALLSLQGPSAAQAAATATGMDLTPLAEGQFLTSPHSPGLFVIAADRTGCQGVDLLLPIDQAPGLWNQLLELSGPEAVVPVGEGAYEMLRVEAGIPRWGHDLDATVIPLEARLNDAISTTKGCYVGQEIIARILSRGRPAKYLVGLLPEGNQVPRPGTTVRAEGRPVGRVTSAVHSPALNRPAALGYLRRDYCAAGTRVELNDGGGGMPAAVRDLPLVARR